MTNSALFLILNLFCGIKTAQSQAFVSGQTFETRSAVGDGCTTSPPAVSGASVHTIRPPPAGSGSHFRALGSRTGHVGMPWFSVGTVVEYGCIQAGSTSSGLNRSECVLQPGPSRIAYWTNPQLQCHGTSHSDLVCI